MLKTISQLLSNYAKGWAILVFLALEILFNATFLAQQGAEIREASGGNGPIDLQFFYTPEKAYAMIESYGAEMRADYRSFELTVDLAYPIVYTILIGLLISWLFRRGLPQESKLHRWNVLPLGGWFFDLLENLSIVGMLSAYPGQPAELAWAATVFTMLKWGFAVASLGLILYGLFAVITRRK